MAFDPAKEHSHIIHPLHGDGTTFKVLGTILDASLKMAPCVDHDLLSVLRLRCLLNQFQVHVWCHCEYNSSCLLLAVSSQLDRINQVQLQYLRHLGLSEEEAFVHFNIAPLGLRRGFAMLGFLHKRVLGLCHPAICQAFPFSGNVLCTHSRALATREDEVISCVHFLIDPYIITLLYTICFPRTSWNWRPFPLSSHASPASLKTGSRTDMPVGGLPS